ncbi:MAG: ATP-binding cassette domain-containing protein, partial [Bacillota bacterium]|nr:ATP-binding cassette domain-containing protein [Bacillota bacterium]
GYVLQNPSAQIITDKVWHEFAFGLESLAVNDVEIRKRVLDIADFFGIQHLLDKKTNELSGGEKQIVNLASVMVMNPKVLLLDEPTSQLDKDIADTFLSAVKKINNELSVTVIITEHRLDSVLPISDRVIVLDKGRVFADCKVSNLPGYLKDSRSGLLLSMPVPLRASLSVNSTECPIDAEQGRKWLSAYKKENNIKDLARADKTEKGPAIVKIENLYFKYGKDLPSVLSGVNLSIYKGEILALLGKNGAGKSTLASLICGNLKNDEGEIAFYNNAKKCALLPQNPMALFVGNTVREDLLEGLEDFGLTKTEKEARIDEAESICNIKQLDKVHPYDVSGGEQQRVALSKILLTDPDILILDEPTKGMDGAFKSIFGDMLKNLSKSGKTIIIISHDIEFCAEYADRCALLKDGKIDIQEKKENFFGSKSGYETAAMKISEGIVEGVITTKDLIKALGGKEEIYENEKAEIVPSNTMTLHSPEKRHKLSKHAYFVLLTILLLMPITVISGLYLGTRQYYFISLALIVETMIPFFAVFEGRHPKSRELMVIAVMCAVAVAGRTAFYMIPQFKPILAIVIISGICLGGESGFLIGAVGMFVSNMFFGQSAYTPWQMFAMGFSGFIAGTLVKWLPFLKKEIPLCIFGFLSAYIIYGGIMDVATVLIYQPDPTWEMVVISFVTAAAFDLSHALSTSFFLLLISKPLIIKLEKIKVKYGMLR